MGLNSWSYHEYLKPFSGMTKQLPVPPLLQTPLRPWCFSYSTGITTWSSPPVCSTWRPGCYLGPAPSWGLVALACFRVLIVPCRTLARKKIHRLQYTSFTVVLQAASLVWILSGFHLHLRANHRAWMSTTSTARLLRQGDAFRWVVF